MEKSIKEVLDGEIRNYILPFFWLRGEDTAIIKEEMRRIKESGIGAVCIESRPHPDFAGESWWDDVSTILEEAKKLDMCVWILDDSHFPTGYANGWIKEKYPEKGKVYLREKHIDALGPRKDSSLLVDTLLGKDDNILAVVAYRRDIDSNNINKLMGGPLDLTEYLFDGVLYWDIPEGHWRVFILFESKEGGGNQDYINPIDPESVRVLIDAVYEPHYEHFKEYFGNTIAGFFSDEPSMGNTVGFDFDESIGRKKMALPWSGEMCKILNKRIGDDYLSLLPALWYDIGEKTAFVRYSYMDIVTELYSKHFSQQLGDWCCAHGVEYIGHVVEDQNVHARLGSGSGHYFRALIGQDMSGLDVIGQQIMPGFDLISHDSIRNTTWDGEFFHYALAKMGSSLGHIDFRKKGRTMCEVYGAYGWMEGLKLMKWLTDHMLVRGVNYFVPHAFSMREFPDPDCPPHFNARGNNPQFRFFGKLMQYTNRLAHLLNDGVHRAPVAILYHAEAEWSGEYMPFQKPARILCRNQIDYDIVPADVFNQNRVYDLKIKDNKFLINKEEYKCLIIPYSQYIPSKVAEFIESALEKGVKIIFIDDLPEGLSDVEKDSILSSQLMAQIEKCHVLKLDEIVDFLKMYKINEIEISSHQPYLRYYHYEKNEADIFMFFNEDPHRDINTEVIIPIAGQEVSIYNAFDNKLQEAKYVDMGNYTKLQLCLEPYESEVYIFGTIDGKYVKEKNYCKKEIRQNYTGRIKLEGPWEVSFASAEEYPEFCNEIEIKKPVNISSPEYYPDFSGTIRYRKVVDLDIEGGDVLLDLGEAYETVEVWINNENVGVKICPPYVFDVGNFIKKGRNEIIIEVINTLVNQERDIFSASIALEPSGLLGPVYLFTK